MALGAIYQGEDELDIVMDTFAPLTDIDDAEQSVFLGILSCLIEAACQAQESGVTRNRLIEKLVDSNDVPIAPVTSRFVMELGSSCILMRQELRQYNGAASDAQRLATDGDNHNWALLSAIH